MSHHHHHHTSLGPKDAVSAALQLWIVLNTLFVLTEATAGWFSHSVALIADAGHNFGDVLGLGISLFAVQVSRGRATPRHTWGFKRSTSLAALANALILFGMVAFIIKEGVERLTSPEPIATQIVVVTALIGILINGLTAWFLRHHHEGDLNIRGAFIHMIGDALVSAGVVVTALLVASTGWLWLDSVMSFIVAGVILSGSWELLVESLRMNLDGVPKNLELAEVFETLKHLPGVQDVHDLHIWHTSTTSIALSVHLVRANFDGHDDFLRDATETLRARFGIAHPTIQVETRSSSENCFHCADFHCSDSHGAGSHCAGSHGADSHEAQSRSADTGRSEEEHSGPEEAR